MSGALGEADRAYIRDLYAGRLEAQGPGVKTVGWGTRESQILRFEVLCRGLALERATVLDFGCGLGDLQGFLQARTGGRHRYVGVDLVEGFVAEARAAYPEADFRVGGLDVALEVEADYVLCSGAFSLRIANNVAHTQESLARLFERARRGVAVNFLSTYVDFQREKDFHYAPEEMFAFAKGLTRWVSLHHDYPLWEFTLQMLREPRP